MRIGIDLGGTKIEGIALDDNGEPLIRHRIATPVNDYSSILQVVTDLIHHIESACGQACSIGIGTPGAISPSNKCLRNSNTVLLNGQSVKQDIEQRLKRKIRMSNDANCFALSEAIDGAAQGASVVFGVIIGTGTGAGIVINGKVLTGPNAIAGEWGHNPLPWPKESELPGPSCYCGKAGCLETFLSGPGLIADYKLINGEEKTSKEIVTLAEKHNFKASRCLQKYEDRLARGLATIINILDPDVIVLGGGMSNVESLYKNVPVLWKQYVFSDTVNTRLLAPMHGDSSGVRGAAWLWE
ncbi:Cryptic sugar kinase Mak [hydrothermal vent metagenome]|uniref:Cryptic sugar kinase Mak n=1 Tax=hydrothermal vent metagenome TaxID=652676 RepID=A0A3B0WZX7_9ZZZZ